MPTFRDQNRRYEQNLEGAYDALLEAKELKELETEALEDEILSDEELFNRLAIQFARMTLSSGYPVNMTFLDYAVMILHRERTPMHTAWEDRV